MTLGLLCSGNLGCEILKLLFNKYTISCVLTDSRSNDIISFCEFNKLPYFKGNPRNNDCNSFIQDKSCDILLSVNYLFLINENLIQFPKKYAINIHGSLLPKYRGRTPHVWAIINNEIKTGITAHLIESGCDTGDIIDQIEIPIESNETGAMILDKFNLLYGPFVEKILDNIILNQVSLTPQDHSKATYFGKRNPEDGRINWNWQKERIHNWVRAQAYPYPGAFTIMEGKQLTIDRISFTNDGYHFQTPNGQIISLEPLKIKTPNGIIQVEQFRGQIGQNIKINTILE